MNETIWSKHRMKRAFFCVSLILCLLSATQIALAQQALDENPFEAGGHLPGIRLGQLVSKITGPDGITRDADQFNLGYTGIGGRFGYNFNRALSIEAEGNFFPHRNWNEVEHSRKAQFFAGFKAGIRSEKFGLFAKARPGLMYFSSIPWQESCIVSDTTPPPPALPYTCVPQKQTNFAFDAGGVVEYYPSPRTIVRFDAGDTIVHFRAMGPTQYFDNSVFTPATTTHNFQCSLGFSIRF
jgi:opacity protein-like surface antigen